MERGGGDPACWAHLVCPGCGLFLEPDAATGAPAPQCPRCGEPIDPDR